MPAPLPKTLSPLPALIFSSRWLQLPLYLGLILAQCVYVVLFVKELWHLVHGAFELDEQAVGHLATHGARAPACGHELRDVPPPQTGDA